MPPSVGTSISNLIDVTTKPLGVPPGAATGIVVSSVSATALTLSWTAPTTGSPPFQYQVQVRPASGGTFVNTGPLTASTSETVFGLTSNTAYQFQVVTVNDTASTPSATALATTSAISPGAATGLAVVGNPGPTSVVLTWQAPATGSAPLSYQVFQASPTGSGNFFPVGSTIAATTTTVTGLTSGVSYDFIVQASNSAGSGPVSATLSNVVAAAGAVLPSAPLNLTSGAITSDSIEVFWSPPSVGTPPLTYTVQYRLAA